MSRIYIKKYCNQKQIILAIKNKLLFQSNKYSAGKEVGKERRKEGRQGGRKEGRKYLNLKPTLNQPIKKP